MHKILVQRAERNMNAPSSAALRRFAKQALLERIHAAELTIRIVSVKEMTALNSTYRHKSGPTNVLSFPFDQTEEMDFDIPLLGDIVICVDVVNQEAAAQSKTAEAHWAHMVVHGTLHLLGHDHEVEADAVKMETEEIRILKSLGFDNPYDINKGAPQ
ncbi:MAG: rRNA maturation RNase YbeY [Gammaproteobacteria bacterium]|nr:rRNA maturation RNase YbeY [Gammaproteobacteria bacterium]